MAAADDRRAREVVFGWWRRHRPLERISAPRIGRRDRAVLATPEEVDQREQRAEPEEDPADRLDHVEVVPAQTGQVRGDTTRHPEQTDDVHREEGHVERDEHRPEAELAETI